MVPLEDSKYHTKHYPQSKVSYAFHNILFYSHQALIVHQLQKDTILLYFHFLKIHTLHTAHMEIPDTKAYYHDNALQNIRLLFPHYIAQVHIAMVHYSATENLVHFSFNHTSHSF